MGSEIGKRSLKSSVKYPPDLSLGKSLAVGVRATKDGVKIISIGEVVKGKYEEALLQLVKGQQEFFADIEGYSYEVETLMDVTEAMSVVGLEAPENM
jgi:hypothetical protein